MFVFAIRRVEIWIEIYGTGVLDNGRISEKLNEDGLAIRNAYAKCGKT